MEDKKIQKNEIDLSEENEFDENMDDEEMEKDAGMWQQFLLEMEQDGSDLETIEEAWKLTKASIKNEYEAVSVYRTYVYLTFRHLKKTGKIYTQIFLFLIIQGNRI